MFFLCCIFGLLFSTQIVFAQSILDPSFGTNGSIRTLLLNEVNTSGPYSVNFNAGKLASGVYFYRMEAGNFVKTKKLIFMK